jgi:hypothetical protein
MPSRGTPQHSIRIPAPLWQAARDKANKQRRDVSAVIRQLLNAWINEGEGEK